MMVRLADDDSSLSGRLAVDRVVVKINDDVCLVCRANKSNVGFTISLDFGPDFLMIMMTRA